MSRSYYDPNTGQELLRCKTGFPAKGVELQMGSEHLDIPMADFLSIVDYVLQNTYLEGIHDPRLSFLLRAQGYRITAKRFNEEVCGDDLRLVPAGGAE